MLLKEHDLTTTPNLYRQTATTRASSSGLQKRCLTRRWTWILRVTMTTQNSLTISASFQKPFLNEIRVCEKPTKKQLIFLKSCFLSLNVKFPRFLVQMSKWCYRSQCSWFCFLFSISRAVPRLDFYLIPYQYCMSHTQWSCVKKITAEAYSHFREPFWGN